MTSRGKVHLTDFEIPIREFLREFNERDIQVTPNPASREQVELANNLSTAITVYQSAVIVHEHALKEFWKKFRAKLDSVKSVANAEPVDIQDEEFGFRELSEAISSRVEGSTKLMLWINNVRAHGMVHDGEGLVKKLRQCQEDNVKLSSQILDYKNELGIKN